MHHLDNLRWPSMAEALSPVALSGLIGKIYDCVLDPSRWRGTLVEIKEALNSENVILTQTCRMVFPATMSESAAMCASSEATFAIQL